MSNLKSASVSISSDTIGRVIAFMDKAQVRHLNAIGFDDDDITAIQRRASACGVTPNAFVVSIVGAILREMEGAE